MLTLGWGMITNLTPDRIGNKADEHWVNMDRLQSPPSFVIKKPCTVHTLTKVRFFHCLKPVIKMLLHPKSLPVTNTPQTLLFRLEMAWVLHAFALLCSGGYLRSVSSQGLQPRFEDPMRFKWMRGFREKSELHATPLNCTQVSAPEESSHHFLNLFNYSLREIAIDFIQQGHSAM